MKCFSLLACILLGLLTLGVSIGGNQARAETGTKADLIFEGGVVFTADSKDTLAECLAVKDGRIVFVGSTADGTAYKGPDTKVVDIKGQMLLPGMMDTHLHAPGTMLTELYEINLAGIYDLDKTMATIEQFIKEHPDLEVYYGEAYNITAFTEGDELTKGPSKKRLDAIESKKPVIITAYDKHSMWLNSAALEKYGITAQSKVPPGGIIEVDEKTGQPWGTLKEFAMDLVPKHAFTDDMIYQTFLLFQKRLHSWGYTAINGISAFEDDSHWSVYKKMHDRGELTLRVHTSFTILPGVDVDEQLNKIKKLKAEYDCDGAQLTIAKYFADGVVDSKTAYLAEPYTSDPSTRGEALWDKNRLAEAMVKANQAGLQNHVHCIGDAAITETLDAYALAKAKLPAGDYRNAITHLYICNLADVPRFKELDVIASMQPYWIVKFPGYWDTVESPFLGPRAEHMYPLKSLLEAGVVLASSSDSPVTPYSYPFVAIEAGVTRNITDGYVGPGYEIRDMDEGPYALWPEQRVSAGDMIKSFTINNAFFTFREKTTGSLELGKAADLVLIDRNILEMNPVDIETVRVLRTYVNGALVYDRATEEPAKE